ncbi:MAG TPA: type II secretion system F family protein [Acidimicrobiales bacterium]|nr:type II secretion system F family protein [Acidimicrobiales bacterium]
MTLESGSIALGVVVVLLVRVFGALLHEATLRRASARLADRAIGPGTARRIRMSGTARLDALCASAGVRVDAGLLIRWWSRSAVVALVGALLAGGMGLAVLVASGVIVGPVFVLRTLAGRADAGYDSALATALDGAARSVRSGASLQAAVTEAAGCANGAVALDLRRVSAAAERGASLVDALTQWVERRPRRSVRLAAGAVSLAVESGGAPGRVLDDVATALRQRHQVEREAHSLAAQARLSGIVVGVAPVAFTVIACAADPRHARVLFATPLGLACLAAGLALDAAGATWMHRISRSVTPW